MSKPRTFLRYIAASLVISAIVGLPTLAEVSTKDVKKAANLTAKGDRALQKGDVGGAKSSFDRALSSVPTFPAALVGLGNIAMAEKKYAAALNNYEKARDGYADLGHLLMQIEAQRYANTIDQISILQDSISQARQSGSGGANLSISKWENEIERLRSIQVPTEETINEPPAEIYFFIGNAHFQMRNVDAAVEAWETCREKNSEFAMVHNNLALAYAQAGRMDDARQSLQRAEKLGFPVNPQFKNDLGITN